VNGGNVSIGIWILNPNARWRLVVNITPGSQGTVHLMGLEQVWPLYRKNSFVFPRDSSNPSGRRANSRDKIFAGRVINNTLITRFSRIRYFAVPQIRRGLLKNKNTPPGLFPLIRASIMFNNVNRCSNHTARCSRISKERKKKSPITPFLQRKEKKPFKICTLWGGGGGGVKKICPYFKFWRGILKKNPPKKNV
jgi:hypothetical protein